jgi:hypothetical protein
MMNEPNEILFSQLADGELDSDQANELLLEVLDEPADRENLKEMLRLRQSTRAWRVRQPGRSMVVVAERPQPFRRRRISWRLGSLAVAACVGGLLVLAGVWAAGGRGGPVAPGGMPTGIGSAAVARVTPEQMQQVAKVFALHESVAGPLAWYADDDQNIRLASARGTEAGHEPIAVMLKLESAVPGTPARKLVIVCREEQPTVIELPAESPGRAGLRIFLSPRTVNGKVDVQYAIAVTGESDQGTPASLSGQRRVGLGETSLGQLAMGEKLYNVEATAWAVPQDRN